MEEQTAVLDMPKKGTLSYLEEFPNEVLTMSFDEYWDFELENEYKSQFYKNKVTPIMAYTSENHNQLFQKTIRLLGDYIDSKKWKIASKTRPVWIPSCELNTYPDIFIVEESNTIKRKGYQLAEITPSVIIEVLSESTSDFDRGEKWRCYKTIDSLKQYVLISQDRILVETYENQEGKWVYNDFSGETATIIIAGLEIPLSILYQNIDFSSVEV